MTRCALCPVPAGIECEAARVPRYCVLVETVAGYAALVLRKSEERAGGVNSDPPSETVVERYSPREIPRHLKPRIPLGVKQCRDCDKKT